MRDNMNAQVKKRILSAFGGRLMRSGWVYPTYPVSGAAIPSPALSCIHTAHLPYPGPRSVSRSRKLHNYRQWRGRGCTRDSCRSEASNCSSSRQSLAACSARDTPVAGSSMMPCCTLLKRKSGAQLSPGAAQGDVVGWMYYFKNKRVTLRDGA